ncbi:trypsin-like serine peptidase [Roseovarius sp. SYSU LYC5161]|uniref:trypsin-like serine peptidase n=1 Tax=Roseovarius halophilus (ex Wu et al. 2025) TaxID=3376060 RepID=UPI0028724FA6|nr:trypsin-like serine protease [Roseovarius sp.]
MRGFLAVFLFLLATGAATAGDSRLQRLDTGDDGRAWEAVGRLDLAGRGFCTATLIAPDVVLTAAHCLFDKVDGSRLETSKIEFLAGWRNGRASAYRRIRRAVLHPDYDFSADVSSDRVRNDIALLKLYHPIRNTRVIPFQTDRQPRKGDRIGVVSYALDRAEAPSLQEVCDVMARQQGMLVMSCEVDFGSSGAPIFSFDSGQARVVSVVSAMAELDGRKVSLGTELQDSLDLLRSRLTPGGRGLAEEAPRIPEQGTRQISGAKFAKP